jgi:NitT/TauT family transport system ATP-binding protein
MGLPFPQQEALFRELPIPLAAKLTGAFPYYHAYVLLHARRPDLTAIVDAMHPGQRAHFFDELPEEAWKQLMDELAVKAVEVSPEPAVAEVAATAPALEGILEARGVEKVFERPGGGRVQVIAPIDLTIAPGEIVALLGPSGCGKSTLLRILTGLTPASSGKVLWRGKPIEEAVPHVAIVFQSFALFPWLTVIDNVEVPLLAQAMAPEERRARAMRSLEAVGLQGFENSYPKDLSGGMKQRVGFARALGVEPEILFMDEPFSALDVLTAENLRGELLELWLGKKISTKSILIVTHNIEEAVLLADRILVLGRNPARVRADFRVPLTQPRDRNSAQFLMYVDYIYKLITQPQLAAEPPTAPKERQRYPMLPHSRPAGIGGLLEILNDRGGADDLYHVADELRMEVDDLLPIVDGASLLGFVRTDKGDVELTKEGKAFAEADIGTRKALFREAALAHVTLLQQVNSTLLSKSDRKMPAEFFRDILDEHFSDEESKRQMETALNWGLYADILRYDADSDELWLFEAPEPAGQQDA